MREEYFSTGPDGEKICRSDINEILQFLFLLKFFHIDHLPQKTRRRLSAESPAGSQKGSGRYRQNAPNGLSCLLNG